MSDPTQNDLFRPSLSAADQTSAFGKPWRPRSLVILCYLGGALAGALLLGLNFGRLGMPGRFWKVLGAGAVLAVFLAAGASLAELQYASTEDPAQNRDARRWIRITQSLAAAGFGLVAAAQQRKRFEMYEATERPPAAILLPGIGAWLGGGVVHLILLFLFQLLWLRLLGP
ncbi:MAG: hypothetical protein FJX77_09945 [Armatimonadetes bacterium]|nr:hypothetical protein [Armatimonadota bacterium]